MAIKAASQVTILDVTDAYAAYLTCYTYSWTGDQTGIAAGNSCVTEAYGYQGSARVQKVSVNVADIVCPAGISATVENNGTAQVKITFQTTEKITSTCEALVPVVLNDDVTMNLKFVFAVAKQGPNGTSVTVSSTSVTYQVGNSGTEKPTGAWEEDVPTAGTGQYLWTKTVVQYSDGKSTESYSVSYNGTNGTNGTSVAITSTEVKYQVGNSGTEKPTGTWEDNVPGMANGQFLWTRTIVQYSDGKSTTSYSVSYKGTNGKDGNPGADAITISITSSNGTIFKNNTGSTVLTAHVFKGGVEQTLTDAGVCGSLGSVKWYKSGVSAAIATAKTLTIAANDVLNSQAYTCQLED